MTISYSPEEQEQPTIRNLTSAEIDLSDPLKSETRKARLYLLGVSMVGITIVHTGLVPQQITTLGITFGEADRRSLLLILALVTLCFLASFVVYGAGDFLASRTALLKVSWSDLRAEARRLEEKYGAWQKDMEDKDIENTVARLDEQEKRVKERVASRLMSEGEAAKEVIEEMAQEDERAAQQAAGRAILNAAIDASTSQEVSLGNIRDEETRKRSIEERVASGLMSKEEASKDIAVLIRRQRKRVAEASRSPATAHDRLPLQVQSEKVERLLGRQAALSPKM